MLKVFCIRFVTLVLLKSLTELLLIVQLELYGGWLQRYVSIPLDKLMIIIDAPKDRSLRGLIPEGKPLFYIDGYMHVSMRFVYIFG